MKATLTYHRLAQRLGAVVALIYFTLGLASAAPTSSPDATHRAQVASWAKSGLYCGDDGAVLPDEWDVNASDVTDWVESRKYYNEDLDFYRTCKPGKGRDIARGYMLSWLAVLQHHQGDVAWHTTLNGAIQALQLCVTKFYGSKASALCQTALDKNIHFKVSWATQ